MDLITVERRGGASFQFQVRQHQVTTDLGPKEGGEDAAPSPSDLLVGALGACVGTMVQLYCDTHGYTDGSVSVSMTYELADDPKRIAAVTLDLELPKDFPEKKHSAVKRVAELCPVHGTLTHPPEIDLEIV